MATVVAFVSQKGGVGKSTLARALATSAVRAGLAVRTVDLDPQQGTISVWAQARDRNKISPPIKVDACVDVKDALRAEYDGLLIIDAPGNISNDLIELFPGIKLLVQPTSPTVDDIYPAVLVFKALENAGMARQKLAFALCRTLADEEALDARTYLDRLGYAVLASDIPEHLDYRNAMKEGRAVNEAHAQALGARAQSMIDDLLTRAGLPLAPHEPTARALPRAGSLGLGSLPV